MGSSPPSSLLTTEHLSMRQKPIHYKALQVGIMSGGGEPFPCGGICHPLFLVFVGDGPLATPFPPSTAALTTTLIIPAAGSIVSCHGEIRLGQRRRKHIGVGVRAHN